MSAAQGWFVVNAGETPWRTHDTFGASCRFEAEPGAFPDYGINLRVLRPGQPNCLYHRENAQEDFLVLAGEALLLVAGEERPLRAWDFVHLPEGTDHVLVGAGDGPCLVLMTGARPDEEELFYPRAEVAVRHGAAAERDTPDADEAYAPYGRPRDERPPELNRLLGPTS
jgi:uncharacterized cupin superfamily protein